MSRTITILNLMLCVGLLTYGRPAFALVSAPPEPQNCWVFKLSSGFNPNTDTLRISPNTVQSKMFVYQPTATQSDEYTHDRHSSGKQSEGIRSLQSWLIYAELPDLPIPASLLFVMLWLIGFKLTRQPAPMLNRAAPPRQGKDFIVMSLGDNSLPAPR